MAVLSALQPAGVWKLFEEITRVPRPSKKEGKILQYLKDFALGHNLECRQDATGNILIRKPATASMASKPAVVLQSHVDMVCEKNAATVFDFDNDAIRVRIDGEWVKAGGTTLGADDGIGMAAALALLESKEIEHPPLEALFTVDEETGLTGAFGLGKDMLTGKYLINLDSEDEGEIFIGCAGGVDTLAYFGYATEPVPAGSVAMRIDISGLTGGHSGDNIDDGLANANKLAARAMWFGARDFGVRLARLEGGNLRNAIPREAYAEFILPADRADAFRAAFEKFTADVRAEYQHTEPNAAITLADAAMPAAVLDAVAQRGLLYALQGVPNGVLAMSQAMPGLVETSTNLASVKFTAPGEITVTSSQRSSIESSKWSAAAAVNSVMTLGGARVAHSEGYPGWAPNPQSHLLEVTRKSYKDLFGVEPKVRAIHAGLECGLFLEKYPQLEMVSFGPTLRGVHSPDERLEIATVDKFWKLLVATLQNI